jgi:uncharacterized protein (TIGR03437 family)
MFSETLKRCGSVALASFLTCGICLQQSVAATTPLAITLADATVPPGGTAQLQFFLNTPAALTKGSAVINLDPAIFGDINAVDVYSATGDQLGTASIQGRQVDIEFSSPTAGAGRLPHLPVITINVPVLATAATGTTSTPTFQTGTTTWADMEGLQYVPAFTGSITIGGALSVQSVQPIGTLLSAGTTVQITGTGFSPTTTATLDGIPIAGSQFISPQQLNITLAALTDLTGRRLTLQNQAGPPVTFYCTLHGDFSQRPTTGTLANIQPIFPSQLYTAANVGNFVLGPPGVAIQNPNPNPINVNLQAVSYTPFSDTVTQTQTTLAPFASYLQSSSLLGGSRSLNTYLAVLPDEPVRVALVGSVGDQYYFGEPAGMPLPATEVGVVVNGMNTGNAFFGWNWTLGTPTPPPIILGVTSPLPVPFAVSVSTQSGGPWLSVTPQEGTAACVYQGISPTTCSAPSIVTLKAAPSQLGPGTYNATVTLTPQGQNPKPTIVPVVLNVYAKPTIFASQSSSGLDLALGNQMGNNVTIRVTGSSDPIPFTTSLTTQSGLNRVAITPTQGQTPATLSLSVLPDAINTVFDDSVTLTINGPNNSVTLNFTASVTNPQGFPPLVSVPASMTFSYQLGQPSPLQQFLNVAPTFGSFTLTSRTTSGGNWLDVAISNQGVEHAIVTADPTGLAADTYQGAIDLTATMASGPATVPVTLVVWGGTPPAITVSPSTPLAFSAIHGSLATTQTVNVATGPLPVPLSISTSTTDGAQWLRATGPNPTQLPPGVFQTLTPTAVTVTADATNLPVGSYTGLVTLTAPTGSANTATIPVTFTVQPPPPPLPAAGTIPLVTAVLNAASQMPGALSPGEIITLFGQNFGPAVPNGVTLSNGKVSPSNNNVQVLFDGTPAPLLYVSSTQINAVVPYEVGGAVTNISVFYNGATIPAGGYSLFSSAPAIFTLNASGQAAVINQDGTVNSASNPAARGSVIQIYATGEGVTQPAGVTGSINTSSARTPVEAVSLTIGGETANISYAASAPGQIDGLLQINAVVPQSLTPNSALPMILTVGAAQSPATATISIK